MDHQRLQGQGAQVVVAGNLTYTVSKHLRFTGGIMSLPGVRSTEGNYPFWLSVDNRMIADEYMRPSYTSGLQARGEIIKKLTYSVMLETT
jgi:arginine/ornithine N-succinyltransferase beta subunit